MATGETQTLYERLGGKDGVTSIANDMVDLHMQNPNLNARFKNSDVAALKATVRDFFAAGIGGPQEYKGKDMRAAHEGMNVSEQEMLAVFDDAMKALDRNGAGQREKDEVLAILYSLKDEILHV